MKRNIMMAVTSLCACADRLLSSGSEMALSGGFLRLKLLSCRHLFTSTWIGARNVSASASSKPATTNESTGDHLIYTHEHFALKESLRKVRNDSCTTNTTNKRQPGWFAFCGSYVFITQCF